MILFLDEDHAYSLWATHHREGFVLAGRHRPRLGHFVLHRAACDEVKGSGQKNRHLTTGGRFLAGATHREELEAWAIEQAKEVTDCEVCRPREETNPIAGPLRLSRLAREVLDYVVESAEIHFGRDPPTYHLTIGDIAGCFAKSPGQLSAALHQLTEQGLAVIEGRVFKDGRLGPKLIVFPTVAALRLGEGEETQDDAEIERDLARLHLPYA